MIVEDDDLLRRIMVTQIAAQYVCAEAKDGQEALQQIVVHRPDVIVLDLLLPILDGFEVLRQLRAMTDPKLAQTPVLVVSNLTDQKSIALAQSLNVIEYYTKSDAQFGVIMKRINKLLGS